MEGQGDRRNDEARLEEEIRGFQRANADFEAVYGRVVPGPVRQEPSGLAVCGHVALTLAGAVAGGYLGGYMGNCAGTCLKVSESVLKGLNVAGKALGVAGGGYAGSKAANTIPWTEVYEKAINSSKVAINWMRKTLLPGLKDLSSEALRQLTQKIREARNLITQACEQIRGHITPENLIRGVRALRELSSALQEVRMGVAGLMNVARPQLIG